ncbi:MAG: DNA translocase FtsK 4TM domain-containing protein, partial [Methylophilus sp.]
MFFNKKNVSNARLEKVSTEKQLRDAKLLREVSWIALAALGVFLAVILASYSHADPGWTHAIGENDIIHNAGGTVGAWIADVLLSLFGFSSWWFVVLAFYIVWLMYQQLHLDAVEKEDWWLNGVGFALLLLASAALESGHLVSFPADFPLKQGGVIGSGIDHLLRNMFGFAGSTMLLLVLFATAFSLFTGWSLISMSERLGEWVIHFHQWSTLKFQDWQDRKVGRQAFQAREEFVESERKRVEDRKPVEIAVPEVLVVPSERVIKEKQTVLFEAIEQEGLPALHLLDAPNQSVELQSAETLDFTSRLIERKLMDFGIEVKVVLAQPGPVITRYELDPAPGVKGSQITNLSKDLARALSVISVRVVETIPGKSYMGLEIPNPKRQIVSLSEIMGSQAYADLNSPIAIAMGKDIAGKPIVADLAKM